jgi:FeS assembly SUF system regulator
VIRITKQADYAIILLGHFVTDRDHVSCNARDLAASTRLPAPMVGKILKTLAKQGLLESHRGAKGGYSLAKPPEKISVAEIIAALDGPFGLTACSVHEGDCEFEASCPTRNHWKTINRAILGALRQVSLREMVGSDASLFRGMSHELDAVGLPQGKPEESAAVACGLRTEPGRLTEETA